LDLQVAIAAVKNAGHTGKARTRDLKSVLMDIKEQQARLGPKPVKFGWVKAHNKLYSNVEVDRLAKEATHLYLEDPQIIEGGLKQAWKRKREEERRVKGAGIGRAVKWNRMARVAYVQYRTGKGNLQAWRHKIGKADNPECRKCGRYAETGKHVALVCTHGEDKGRRWGTWEDMDDSARWARKESDREGFYMVDLVETFFSKIDLR